MSKKMTPWSIRLVCALILLTLFLCTQGWNVQSIHGSSLISSRQRPTITPIPRPTLTPALVGKQNPARADSEVLVGSRIILQVSSHLTIHKSWWTIVQWQDGQGSWHDVEGWRGQFGPGYRVSWWVAPKDATTGPFRWIIYEGEESRQVIWTSAAFYLPSQGEELFISWLVPAHR